MPEQATGNNVGVRPSKADYIVCLLGCRKESHFNVSQFLKTIESAVPEWEDGHEGVEDEKQYSHRNILEMSLYLF